MNRLRGSGGTANFRRMPPPCYDGEENYRDWSLRGSSTKSITERNCIAVWRKRRFKISIPFPPSLSALFRRDYIAMIVSINPWFLPFFYFNSTRRWFDAYINPSFPISRPCRVFFNAQGAKPVWYAKATRLVYGGQVKGHRFCSNETSRVAI